MSGAAGPAAGERRLQPNDKAGPVRFGILGCGGIGRWHARNVRALPGLELAAMADPDPGARDRGRDLGVPIHPSAEDLLARPDVEVVCVCTPPAHHASLIEAAARAGKHVLVEKPLALDLADADRAIAACRRSAVHLGVAHQQRARSGTRALARLAHDGALGRLVLGAVTHAWHKTQERMDRDAWRGDAAAGGGVLLDEAVHGLDLLTWFLGEPVWVQGATRTSVLRIQAEDTAVATIGFESGALATLAAGSAVNAARDDIAVEILGTRGMFRIEVRDYDDAEIVRLDLAQAEGARARPLAPEQVEAVVRAESGSWRGGPVSPLWRAAARLAGPGRGVRPFRSPLAYLRRQADRKAQREQGEPQGHAALLAAMAAAARGRGAPLVTGEDARPSLAIVDGLRRSAAAGGARVALTGAEPA
jgi:predicted dehydrogenase